MRWQWLIWLMLPLAGGGALWLSTPRPPEWKVQADGQSCETQPFALGENRQPNRVENGTVLMAVSDAYMGVICSPSVLIYQARGDFGEGRGPRLLVSSADGTLFDGELTKENRAYTFPVQPGPIAFVFEDDYAGSAGDRNVWLSGVTVATR